MHILPKVLSWGKCKWSILAAKFGTNSIGKNTKQIIMWCEASLWCFEMAPKSICLSQFLFLVWFIQISGVSFRWDKSTFVMERFFAGEIFQLKCSNTFQTIFAPPPSFPGMQKLTSKCILGSYEAGCLCSISLVGKKLFVISACQKTVKINRDCWKLWKK